MKRYQLLRVILFHALLSTKHTSPSVLLPPMQRKEKGCACIVVVAWIKSIEIKRRRLLTSKNVQRTDVVFGYRRENIKQFIFYVDVSPLDGGREKKKEKKKERNGIFTPLCRWSLASS